MQGLDLIAGALQSFTEFIQAQQTVGILDQEPYFAGFFLHESQYSHQLHQELKQLFCKIAPVFVHLSQASTGRTNADWWCCSEDSCAIMFMRQSPGWVVHKDSKADDTCASSPGFDVFLPPGKHSASFVNPATLLEGRVSKFLDVITDAHSRNSVPFCNTILKELNFAQRFRSLCSQDLVLADKTSVVWSYIDVSLCEFVHVIVLLSKAQFSAISKHQKTSYLHAMTWIISRTGAAAFTKSCCSDMYFAVRTGQCFMLHQMGQIRATHVPTLLRQFYSNGGPLDLLPDQRFLTTLTEQYRTSSILKGHSTQSAHLDSGRAMVIFTQMYDESLLNDFRPTLNILPTLEFYENSCWMETAINMFFSIPTARLRIFSSLNQFCKYFCSLYNVMCVYGPVYSNMVPALECKRCGVYPVEDLCTAPAILGPEGYNRGIFCNQELKWGSYGSAHDTLFRFCELLDLSVEEVLFDPSRKLGDEYWLAMESGFESDVCVVSFAPEVQPSVESEIVEVSSNGFCCGVTFCNLAHNFSVCKSVIGGNWTVKDALVQEFSTHATFGAALARARQLHAKVQNYIVQLVVYFKSDM